jgi:hypothetical protein
MTQRWLWSAIIVVGFAVTLSAQTPKPTFEVTSVKRRIGPGPSAYVPPLAQGTGFSMYTSERPRRINGVTLPVNPDRSSATVFLLTPQRCESNWASP